MHVYVWMEICLLVCFWFWCGCCCCCCRFFLVLLCLDSVYLFIHFFRGNKFDQDNLCLFQLKAIKNTDRNFDFHANFLSGTYFVHMLRLFACLLTHCSLARLLACLLTQCRKCIAILLMQPQCLIRNTFLFFIRCVFDSSTIFHILHPFIFLYVVHVISAVGQFVHFRFNVCIDSRFARQYVQKCNSRIE